jgi:hypothetical protein
MYPDATHAEMLKAFETRNKLEAVHSLDITPQMKSKALKEGMPLFSLMAGLGVAEANKKNDNQRLLEKLKEF